jgi:tRNA (guanosine-2'-O-)-methyltransferase
VAAALILFEAQRQRLQAGYDQRLWLDSETYCTTLFEWAYPRLARYCRRKDLPYPRLNADGERLDSIPR